MPGSLFDFGSLFVFVFGLALRVAGATTATLQEIATLEFFP